MKLNRTAHKALSAKLYTVHYVFFVVLRTNADHGLLILEVS